MQTAEPCIGNSSLNTATNFRSLSDAQRLPCSTPAGGVQYGKMNLYNMSNLGNNQFFVVFSDTTSDTGKGSLREFPKYPHPSVKSVRKIKQQKRRFAFGFIK